MNEQQEQLPKPKFFLDTEIRTWLKDNLTVVINKYNANATSIYLPNANKYTDLYKIDTYISIVIDGETITTSHLDGSLALQHEANFRKEIDSSMGNYNKQSTLINNLEQRVSQLENQINILTNGK